MRGAFAPAAALAVTSVLLEEEINVFELTMNSDAPIEALKTLKDAYGEQAFVGMGTVLSVDEAKQVIDAGGQFIVSPAFDPDVVQYVLDAGVMMIPGVITPSEAVMAWKMGVPLLKLFPVGALGVAYFKTMFGPLNHMKFMCNGAINQENARSFIQAGAVACGMAGWLTGDGTTPSESIRARAAMIKTAVAQGKQQAAI
jgi:2-dehydro-3-deoxyphosphogluconate aldolase/(4S)-4-hydroxy-2-oxoglutarate aldolase